MYKRKIIIALGIITGVFIATSLRADLHPPKVGELEEFRAVLNNMVHISLPQDDFDYIAARKIRLTNSRDRVKKVELPDSLEYREKDYKKARKYFMKVSGEFLDVMASDKYDLIRERLLALDTAFALLYVSLGGPPPAVDQYASAATPFTGDKKHPPQIPPRLTDIAALRQAVANLLATKIGGDYRVVQESFDRERDLAAKAVEALGPMMAEGDSVKIHAAMRGVVASSERLADVFEPRQ